MALLGSAQKLIVVLVLIVAVLALVIGIFVGHSLTVVPLNTNTQSWNWYGWQGVGENGNGQLLDASSYATSWSTVDGSEKIVISGGVTVPGFGSLACVQAAQFQVWTSPDGLAWTQVQGSPFPVDVGSAYIPPGGSIAYPALTYVYYGPFSGGLKADLQVHILDVADPTCSVGVDKGFLTVAEDQAYLVSSAFTMTTDTQGQIGQTVHATVSVGYLTAKSGGPGWKFWGFSEAQNKVVVGPFESGTPSWNQATQTFSYTITTADFSTAAGCGNGNRIDWYLWNELWPRTWQWTTTVDISAYSPSFSFDGWSGQNVENGSVVVKFHAAPNSVTNAPVQKIVLSYGFGSPQLFNLTANTTQQTIQLGQNGLLHLEGYALDTACRPSKSARLDIYVYPSGQQPPGAGPPDWLVFFLIVGAFAAIGVFVAYMAKGPLWSRLLAFAVLFLAGLVLAFIAQPKVLDPKTWAAGFIPLLRAVITWR